MTHHDDLLPPAPRRSDDAFSRAVRADVTAARAARVPLAAWLGVPLAAAAALAFVVVDRGPSPTSPSSLVGGASLAALVEAEVDAEDDARDVVDAVDASDDDTLLAFAGDAGSDLPPAFAFADLDGSTEQDLAAVEAALDLALARL